MTETEQAALTAIEAVLASPIPALKRRLWTVALTAANRAAATIERPRGKRPGAARKVNPAAIRALRGPESSPIRTIEQIRAETGISKSSIYAALRATR